MYSETDEPAVNPQELIRERMLPERLAESSPRAQELATDYLNVLRGEIPSENHFGSVHSIHTLKDALLAMANHASESRPLPELSQNFSPDELKELLNYAAVAGELEHRSELLELIDNLSIALKQRLNVGENR